MSLFSWQYVFFVAVALAGHHLLPVGRRPPWLLVCSYAFYALLALRFLPLLLLLTLLTHVAGGRVERGAPGARVWLVAAIGIHLGSLAGVRLWIPAAPFESPFAVLGIAFYSLQAISFLVDRHAGRQVERPTLTELALYLGYFAKMPAGPIERARRFIPRARQPAVIDDAALARAVCLVAAGLFRKLVLADPLRSLVPADVFTDPRAYGAQGVGLALLCFGCMLYNDFAGYTGIARGTSALFGIELSPNFRQPFLARSFHEFWARWHITLTLWLRDYVFVPIAVALRRAGRARDDAAMVFVPRIAALVGIGVWHGTGVHMVVWGSLQGFYLGVERWLEVKSASRGRRSPLGIPRVLAIGIVTLAFFRMDTGTAIVALETLVGFSAGLGMRWGWLALVAASFVVDLCEQRWGETAAVRLSPPLQGLLLFAVVATCLLATQMVPPSYFVYQGF